MTTICSLIICTFFWLGKILLIRFCKLGPDVVKFHSDLRKSQEEHFVYVMWFKASAALWPANNNNVYCILLYVCSRLLHKCLSFSLSQFASCYAGVQPLRLFGKGPRGANYLLLFAYRRPRCTPRPRLACHTPKMTLKQICDMLKMMKQVRKREAAAAAAAAAASRWATLMIRSLKMKLLKHWV